MVMNIVPQLHSTCHCTLLLLVSAISFLHYSTALKPTLMSSPNGTRFDTILDMIKQSNIDGLDNQQEKSD